MKIWNENKKNIYMYVCIYKYTHTNTFSVLVGEKGMRKNLIQLAKQFMQFVSNQGRQEW